jgi:outer membrane lipoprotein-sorting protein
MKAFHVKARKLAQALAPALLLAVPGIAFAQNDLESVLSKMDQAAAHFQSAEANFTWTTFNSVVNEADRPQIGKIYFRRTGKETEMQAEIGPPDAEQVLYSGGKIQIYRPRMDIVDVYDAGAHREEAETFLVLGFGSSGEEMRKSFDVKYDGMEKVDAVNAAKLDLVPKAENIKRHFSQIILWIDPSTGVSVQQKLIEGNGDYRLAKYSDIRLNKKIPDKVFKLKTSDRTKVVSH